MLLTNPAGEKHRVSGQVWLLSAEAAKQPLDTAPAAPRTGVTAISVRSGWVLLEQTGSSVGAGWAPGGSAGHSAAGSTARPCPARDHARHRSGAWLPCNPSAVLICRLSNVPLCLQRLIA